MLTTIPRFDWFILGGPYHANMYDPFGLRSYSAFLTQESNTTTPSAVSYCANFSTKS